MNALRNERTYTLSPEGTCQGGRKKKRSQQNGHFALVRRLSRSLRTFREKPRGSACKSTAALVTAPAELRLERFSAEAGLSSSEATSAGFA